VIVAVYSVRGARFAAGVKVALVFPASRATAPVGLTQGAAQVTVKLAAPVIGAIASLNAAVIAVLIATPVALLTGATAVTVGAIGAAPVVNCHV
jgi:hypothetical protein